MPDKQTIEIFIASAGELQMERKECILILNKLNKSHKHLDLEPVEWEFDVAKGNVPGYSTIQKAINPKLIESDMAVFMFYSKLGTYTREEFELAATENKKFFAYFKKGFSPTKDTFAAYGNLLDFKDSLNDTVLYEEYENITEFEKLLFPALNLYLTETYPVTAISVQDAKLSESVLLLVQQLTAKDEEIKSLREASKILPPFSNDDQLDQLIRDKQDLEQQLLQNKEIQEQQAKAKAELEVQLSQYKDNDALKTKALEEVEKGNYNEAEAYLKESAKKSITDTAATFYELAKIKNLQLQYKEAFEYYEIAVKVNPENSLYLNEAGVIADTLGFYDKALNYYEKSLGIDIKNYGEEHPDIAIRYNNLGLTYNGKGEYNKAIEYYEMALIIEKKYYGEEHPDIAICYNNLSLAYDNKGEYDKAIAYYQKALVIDKKYHGEEHPAIAVYYNNLGAAYNSKGEYEKAIEYYNKTLVIDKKYYGEEHPDIAIDYNNLGAAYRSKGEYEKAIEYYQKALVIGKKYYGEEHPKIATRYNNLGEAYRSKGEYEKAIKNFQSALIIFQKFLPSIHPHIQITQKNLQFAQEALAKQ